MSGLVQVNANSFWQEVLRGMMKKASLRSRTEKRVMVGGIWDKRV